MIFKKKSCENNRFCSEFRREENRKVGGYDAWLNTFTPKVTISIL
jgi:hypothetical protein